MNILTRVIASAVIVLGFVGDVRAQVVSMLVGNQAGFPGIDRYALSNGSYQGVFASVGSGGELSYFKYGGPSTDLFAVQGNNVLRFDGNTGNFVSTFINQPGAQFCFGLDNNLYRLEPFSPTQFFPAGIGRYDGATGARLGTFVPANSSGITVATGGLRFAPNGNLYVDNSDRMLEFDGTTGAPFGPFFTPGTAGLSSIGDAIFASNGDLIVSALGAASDRLYRFNGTTGSYLGLFSSGNGLDGPVGLVEGPDTSVYVASIGNDRILRFELVSGTFLGNFVANTAHMNPSSLVISPFPIPEPSSLLFAALAATACAVRVRGMWSKTVAKLTR